MVQNTRLVCGKGRGGHGCSPNGDYKVHISGLLLDDHSLGLHQKWSCFSPFARRQHLVYQFLIHSMPLHAFKHAYSTNLIWRTNRCNTSAYLPTQRQNVHIFNTNHPQSVDRIANACMQPMTFPAASLCGQQQHGVEIISCFGKSAARQRSLAISTQQAATRRCKAICLTNFATQVLSKSLTIA